MRRYLRSEIVKFPRVHRVRKGGKIFKYHKVTRAPLPNDIPEDHNTFVIAWTAEESKKPQGRQKAGAGTIADGVAKYLRSAQYKALSKEYAATISRNARDIGQTYGEAPLSRLCAKHIDADLAKLTGVQRSARRKTWRQLGAFWKEAQLVNRNPSEGIMSVKAAKTEGHIPWTADQNAAFRAFWPIGTVQRLCFELVFWTGARTVDAVRLGPRLVGSDGLLTLTQNKTNNPAYVPWTSPLPDWGHGLAEDRAALMACLPKGVFTYLETAGGKPRSKKGLSNVISAAARKAGIEKRSAHGLRKSRLTILAEFGASVHVIMAWGGHKTLSEAQEYIKSANMKKVLIGTEQDRNMVNPVEPGVKLSQK